MESCPLRARRSSTYSNRSPAPVGNSTADLSSVAPASRLKLRAVGLQASPELAPIVMNGETMSSSPERYSRSERDRGELLDLRASLPNADAGSDVEPYLALYPVSARRIRLGSFAVTICVARFADERPVRPSARAATSRSRLPARPWS